MVAPRVLVKGNALLWRRRGRPPSAPSGGSRQWIMLLCGGMRRWRAVASASLGAVAVAAVVTIATPSSTPALAASGGSGRAARAAPVAPSPVALAGCPVPPHAPPPTPSPPWHPSVLVTSLPPVTAPAPWTSHVTAISGKGMWIWEWGSTDGGNAGDRPAGGVGGPASAVDPGGRLHERLLRGGGTRRARAHRPRARHRRDRVGFSVLVGPRRRRRVDRANP